MTFVYIEWDGLNGKLGTYDKNTKKITSQTITKEQFDQIHDYVKTNGLSLRIVQMGNTTLISRPEYFSAIFADVPYSSIIDSKMTCGFISIPVPSNTNDSQPK